VPSRPAFLGHCAGCRKNGDLLARVGDVLWAACSLCKVKWCLGDLKLDKTANAFPRSIANFRIVATPPLRPS
jgi:hypothetical protein